MATEQGKPNSSRDPSAALSFVQRLAEDLEDKTLVLPAIPDAVTRLQIALQSSENDTDDIVKIITTEPALAARILQIGNAWAIRRSGPEVTDLAQAVNRMGYKMVRSIAIAFGLRRFQGTGDYSPTARRELTKALADAIQVAATSSVLARHHTRLNSDDALLTGLLHALGRLYIIKRASEMKDVSDDQLQEVFSDWHPTIGKAIADSWGLPEAMGIAIEHQDDTDVLVTGSVTLTDVLIAAKLVIALDIHDGAPDGSNDLDSQCLTVFEKLEMPTDRDGLERILHPRSDEIDQVRASLTA